MTSTLAGDDPLHDLNDAEKDRTENELRRKARAADAKTRNRLIKRANEISRPKSKRAHQDQD